MSRNVAGEVALAAASSAYEAAQEHVERAEMALKAAQSKTDEVQVGVRGQEETKLEGNLDIVTEDSLNECEKELEAAITALKERKAEYAKCEEELSRIQFAKVEIQEKEARLSEMFESAKNAATAADSEVAVAMSLAEESVAMEVEAAQRVSDGEIALQKAEGSGKDAAQAAAVLAAVDIADKLSVQVAKTAEVLLIESELKQEDVEELESIAAEVEEKVVTFSANLFAVNAIIEYLSIR